MNKPFRKILYFPVTKIILGVGFCLALLVGVQNLITKPLFYTILSSKPVADTIINYLSVAVLLLTYFYLFRFYEKRKITELATSRLAVEFPLGFIFGFSVLSLVILILYVSGYYSIHSTANFSYMLAPFSFLVIAALMEEIFFRLIIYRILEEWLGTYLALLIIALLFMVPHLANNDVSVLAVLLLLIFGFTHGVMYTYTKRLWLPFAFHLGWNFAQPFYGSNLSGMKTMGAVFKAEYKGPIVFIGSGFGIEDSIFSIVFLLIIGIVFLWLSRREGKIIRRKKNR